MQPLCAALIKLSQLLHRWLSARAPGISEIVLDLFFERPADDSHANADLIVSSLLPALLALLKGSRVDLELRLEGETSLCLTQVAKGLDKKRRHTADC